MGESRGCASASSSALASQHLASALRSLSSPSLTLEGSITISSWLDKFAAAQAATLRASAIGGKGSKNAAAFLGSELLSAGCACVNAVKDRSLDARTGETVISPEEFGDSIAVLRSLKRSVLGDCWEPCYLFRNMGMVRVLRDSLDHLLTRLSKGKQLWSKREKLAKKQSGRPIECSLDAALSKEILTVPQLLGITSEEEREREALRGALEAKFQTMFSGSSLSVFGSSGSALGRTGCDLDMTICLSKPPIDEATDQGKVEDEADDGGADQGNARETIAAIAILLGEENDGCEDGAEWEGLDAITTARVPIVRFVHGPTKLQCDICQDNVFALRNTLLLRTYALVSPRARSLIFTVKLWAKSKGISDASRGTLSSYAWVLLVIFYLQWGVKPPILPRLQDADACLEAGGELSGDKPTQFCEDVEVARSMVPEENSSSLAMLLKGFFEFYAHSFSKAESVVSVRLGRPFLKGKRRAKWRLCVEDPFELDHDLGSKIANKAAQRAISVELHRACCCFDPEHCSSGDDGDLKYLYSGLLSKRQDASSRCFARTCHLCGSHDHMSRDCPLAPPTDLSQVCFNCGQPGHLARDCAEKRKKKRNKGKARGKGASVARKRDAPILCHSCGGAGHLARDCQNKTKTKTKKKKKKREKVKVVVAKENSKKTPRSDKRKGGGRRKGPQRKVVLEA